MSYRDLAWCTFVLFTFECRWSFSSQRFCKLSGDAKNKAFSPCKNHLQSQNEAQWIYAKQGAEALPSCILEAGNRLFQRELALSDRQSQVEQLLMAQAEPQVMKSQPHQGAAQRSPFVGIDEGVSA